MKKKDHKALAYYLLESVGVDVHWEKRWHRRSFLLGCVCPDYLPFTYLRGFRQSHAMLGHNTLYSGAHISKSIGKLKEKGIRSWRDCWALGTLMHYLADSFTFPHTQGFEGSMREHRAYEKTLHGFFAAFLSHERACSIGVRIPEKIPAFLQLGRAEYEREAPSFERDCRRIIASCSGVFHALSVKQN